MVSSDEASTSERTVAIPWLASRRATKHCDLAGAAAADQIEQVDLAQDRSERAAEQAVVDVPLAMASPSDPSRLAAIACGVAPAPCRSACTCRLPVM